MDHAELARLLELELDAKPVVKEKEVKPVDNEDDYFDGIPQEIDYE